MKHEPSMTQSIPIQMPGHATWSTTELELRITAFHEAGHAVLAKLSGTHFVGAIDARPESPQGSFDCKYGEHLHNARNVHFGIEIDAKEESAVISAAGRVAQERFMIENSIGTDHTGRLTASAQQYVASCALGDYQEVENTLGPGRWKGAKDAAERHLGVERIWRAVESLANEVIRRDGYMSEQAVDSTMHCIFVDLDLPEALPLI